MSLSRPKKSKVWVMDFHFRGQRIRETTGTSSKSLAQKIEGKRRHDLESGAAGIKQASQPKLLSVAAEDFLETKKPSWSPGMYVIAKTALTHLLPELGRKLVMDIETRDIAKYQKARTAAGASAVGR